MPKPASRPSSHQTGPVSGGFSDEDVPPGQRGPAAFDQIYTGNAGLTWREHKSGFWATAALEYGSGTPATLPNDAQTPGELIEADPQFVAALGGDREKAKALALLLMPYFITGLFELGLAMSLHYAFRPAHADRTVRGAVPVAQGAERAHPARPLSARGSRITRAETSGRRVGADAELV